MVHVVTCPVAVVQTFQANPLKAMDQRRLKIRIQPPDSLLRLFEHAD
jgi:hypothetical protein